MALESITKVGVGKKDTNNQPKTSAFVACGQPAFGTTVAMVSKGASATSITPVGCGNSFDHSC
jgi:hypothetical protein